MSKGKSITLLTIISVLMTFVLVMTFARFPVGIKNYNSALGAIQLDYDIEGGVGYTLSISKDNEIEVENVDEVIKTLSERLERLGYKTYSVKAVKNTDEAISDYDIRIEVRDSDNAASDMAVVTEYGKVKFYGGSSEHPSTEILADYDVVNKSAYLGMNGPNDHVVAIEFNNEAKDKLVELIGKESSYFLKITCGEDSEGNEKTLFDSAITKEAFVGTTLAISHIQTEQDAERMALQMSNGGLEYRYELSDGVKVSSPYGKDIAVKCAVAVITLVLISIIILAVLYRGLGAVASLSLLLFILCETWLLIGVPGIVVSMGGIIGIIASTILCVVTLSSTMQRVKDEYASSKKTVKAAINKGFMNSLVPAISAHVISGAVALLMLAFTKGVVRSFAITFGIGVAVSLIATLVFTRMFNAILLPLAKDPEKFLKFKRNEEVATEEEGE